MEYAEIHNLFLQPTVKYIHSTEKHAKQHYKLLGGPVDVSPPWLRCKCHKESYYCMRKSTKGKHLLLSTYLLEREKESLKMNYVYEANWQNQTTQWSGSLLCCELTLREDCTADSGGYTIKWRSVKPKPWEVRRRCNVLGPGHEKGSSSAAGDKADASLRSQPSFCLAWEREKNTNNYSFRYMYCDWMKVLQKQST